MIGKELEAELRRLFFAEHWKIGTIASELGVHHDTVRRVINPDRFVSRGRARPSLLDPYKDFIERTLDKHPRLRATRLHEMLRARGYMGSVVQVRRYVRRVRPQRSTEAFLALDTLPGEQGQVDWASFGRVQVGKASRALSCFVLVLSWSRAMYARFTLDQRLESFVHGHRCAFEALGGVPRTLLYDNLKSVVLDRHGEHVQYHPRVLELAGITEVALPEGVAGRPALEALLVAGLSGDPEHRPWLDEIRPRLGTLTELQRAAAPPAR